MGDPPSISAISKLLRGSTRKDDIDGKKDYSIDGILGGELFYLFIFYKIPNLLPYQNMF